MLPPCLLVHLQRFRYDFNLGRRMKLDNRMAFPMDLDMGQFIDDIAHIGGSTQYELSSALVHSGGAFGGHYIA